MMLALRREGWRAAPSAGLPSATTEVPAGKASCPRAATLWAGRLGSPGLRCPIPVPHSSARWWLCGFHGADRGEGVRRNRGPPLIGSGQTETRGASCLLPSAKHELTQELWGLHKPPPLWPSICPVPSPVIPLSLRGPQISKKGHGEDPADARIPSLTARPRRAARRRPQEPPWTYRHAGCRAAAGALRDWRETTRKAREFPLLPNRADRSWRAGLVVPTEKCDCIHSLCPSGSSGGVRATPTAPPVRSHQPAPRG